MAKIQVKDTEVSVVRFRDEDYISLTDMLKAKDGEFFFYNWLRNRNTVEFLGIWERLHNPDFNSVDSTELKLLRDSTISVSVPRNGWQEPVLSVLYQGQEGTAELMPTKISPLNSQCGSPRMSTSPASSLSRSWSV